MGRTARLMVAGLAPLLLVLLVQMATTAQGPPASQPAAVKAGFFEFEVVESFDAKYQGDTPGHVGRNGGLEDNRPRIALGDPVFRGDQQVGTVTGVIWDRGRGSLQVEFDPGPGVRIHVGETVSIALDTMAAKPR